MRDSGSATDRGPATAPGPASAATGAKSSTPTSIAYPLDEFYCRSGLSLPPLEIVDAEGVPEPYRSLLVHERDMTSTLEAFHQAGIHLSLISRHQHGQEYF